MENRLKQIRKEQNYNQKDVSLKTGIPQNTLSNYENNKREPSLVIWRVLADFYGVGVDWLRGTSEDKIGFKDWEDATGYTKEQITDELSKLSKIGYLTGNMQHDIGVAVATLEGQKGGHGELSAINEALNMLSSITGKIEKNYFLDPHKKIDDADNINGIFLRNSKNDFGAKYYYSDMDPDLMKLIRSNITYSKRILSSSTKAFRNARKTYDIDEQLTFIDDLFDDFKQEIYKYITDKLNTDVDDK
ncbi:helix-turn-helix domain-containing protein [Weissella paramesenteroides]|uniref:helix-turn-helix domain-containing protein n=1 Tax=Weissella paramesenteroides TaxID=1249 RepID=UPI00388F42F3